MKPSIQTILLFLIACSCSTIQVTSDYDKSADFSKYKTFAYYGWSDNSDKVLNDFDKKRIEDAFGNEFARRGWSEQSESADAIVSLFIVVDEKTSYSAYTNHYGNGAYGGMYGPSYGGWGTSGSSSTTVSQNDYLEGTLIVDVFDAAAKKHIWQGVGKKTLSEKSSNREARIQEAVAAIMKQFPVSPLETSK